MRQPLQEKEFERAIKEYLDTVHEDWDGKTKYQRDHLACGIKMITVFQKIPKEARINCQYLFLKTITKPSKDESLDKWRCKLGHELINRMENVK
jgi:hypothetical protein